MSKEYTSELDAVLIKLALNKQEEEVPSRIPFSEDGVRSGLYKQAAFDVYKVENDPYESLWLLQDFEDGQHLVRASIPEISSEEKGFWNAISDSRKENITLNYKNVPIARFSSKEYNFAPEDAITFKSALLDSAESDEDFVKSVLFSQPTSKREALVRAFPEFKKFI